MSTHNSSPKSLASTKGWDEKWGLEPVWHARVLANDKGNFTTFKFNLQKVAINQEAGIRKRVECLLDKGVVGRGPTLSG